MRIIGLNILILLFFACSPGEKINSKIIGTWELQSGLIIKNNDTVRTDYTKGQRLIKIINETHFSFIRHDLNKGKDSLAIFIAGAGNYSFDGKIYHEELEFCSGRNWEGKKFTFDLIIKNDTLIQKGIEKIEDLGIDQKIIETYIRVKN